MNVERNMNTRTNNSPFRSTPQDRWPERLASQLFASPARWGWQAVAAVTPPASSPIRLGERPVWLEPPRPDTSSLHSARSKAVSKVIRRVAFAVIVVFAFIAFRVVIEQKVHKQDKSTQQIYLVVLVVVAVILAIGIIRALAGIRRATAAIHAFEQPYLMMRAADRQRYEQAVREWDAAVRQQQVESAAAAKLSRERANGPLWFPVRPASQPTRVDVFGGDPQRNGWASLLVTLGTSILAEGNRLTILDLTGQDVGGGLFSVAEAYGLPTSRIDLEDGSDAYLLDGVPPQEIAECLAYATTERAERADLRQERALAKEMLKRVLSSLSGHPSFGRLAAGIRVLRQGMDEGTLTDEEISRLASHIGDVDQNEWTSRQLRFLASQLDTLQSIAPATGSVRPLWTKNAVTLISTPGGHSDRKELLDRLLIQASQSAMYYQNRLAGFLIVIGADHLGAQTLTKLSDHARRSGVRLVLMIDQPQGELEKTAGTGGAVCVMKMYNHRDAAIAAEFVGKGHKFVINQITRQVGKSFGDSGGDSFGANTGHSDSFKPRLFGMGNVQSPSDSRGHTWTGTRGWSTSENLSTSTASSRVHEFIVDPQEILGMPETAFILIDNTTQGRRVAMVDGNPGICLLDRVSPTPR